MDDEVRPGVLAFLTRLVQWVNQERLMNIYLCTPPVCVRIG